MLGSPTRDSNSTVENWMKILKIDTLGRAKRLRVGKFVRTVHITLIGRLKEHILAPKRKKTEDENTQESPQPPKRRRPNTDEPEDGTESWNKKETSRQDHT